MKTITVLIVTLFSLCTYGMQIDEIHIYKSRHLMQMLAGGKQVKSYKIMLGRGGPARKRKQGDNRVPEGQYFIDYKNPESLFYKSLHISYPNDEDKRNAAEAGVDPGGDIMIHGFPNHPKPFFKFLKRIGLIRLVDWTAGCIAVDDEEMDEIFNTIEVQTPIKIFN